MKIHYEIRDNNDKVLAKAEIIDLPALVKEGLSAGFEIAEMIQDLLEPKGVVTQEELDLEPTGCVHEFMAESHFKTCKNCGWVTSA